tara:strand:+ start:2193 stop:3215 length:1023 start_codon:yes stop_codon:yes gene_type:complete
MAKDKKIHDLSETEIQDQPIDSENKLKREINKNTSAANTSQGAVKQGVQSINEAKKKQAEQMQKQQQQQGSNKDEFLNRTRDSLDTQFKDAMSYFGPRLVAQLFGGNSAMAMTDKVMSGFEGYQARQLARKQSAEDRQFELQQRKNQLATGNMGTTADRKLAFEKKKYQEEKQLKIDKDIEERESAAAQINDMVSEIDNVKAELGKFPGSVGLMGGSEMMRKMDEASGDTTSSAKEDVRRRLLTLTVEQTLENAAKLKGPISEKELNFLKANIPKLTAPRKSWDMYLDRMKKAMVKKEGRQTKGIEQIRQQSQQFQPGSTIEDETGKQYIVMPDGSYREK